MNEFGDTRPCQLVAIKHKVPYENALFLVDWLIHKRKMPDDLKFTAEFASDCRLIADRFKSLQRGEV